MKINNNIKIRIFSSLIILLLVGVIILIITFTRNNKTQFVLESDQTVSYIKQRDPEISVLALGDMMFDRGVKKWMNEGIDPFKYIDLSEYEADIIIGNLEGPITDNERCQKKPYSFRFPTSTALYLVTQNIGYLNIANNHSFDCYDDGLKDTRFYLESSGIKFFGDKNLSEFSTYEEIVKGKKIGFIGVDLTISRKDENNLTTLVSELSSRNDYVFVSIHWGEEYKKEPLKWQRELAYRIIDAGATVIFGHHPHVFGEIEEYNGRMIFYSLGNFIFDQIGEEVNKGFVVKLNIDPNEPIEKNQKYTLYPYKIEKGQPKLN